MLVLLVLLAGAGGLVYFFLPLGGDGQARADYLTHHVERGKFLYEVTERGEIESSSNVEVRCEVQSRNTGGTAILEIVPEGTYVEKRELIARLDKSALENEYNQQQITCNASNASVIQAQSALATAQIARREYLDGTFRQDEQILLGEISVAEENLRRAEDYAGYSQKLAAKDFVTQLQLEADLFAVEKAKMDLATAKTKIEVMREFTKAKMLTQLEADIKIAEANLASNENVKRLDEEKLALIQAQIDKCEILAPSAGQVVYANSTDRRGDSEVVIQEGALIRERQVIVRLPDPKRMQVRAKINEARVDRVKEGQPVVIQLDAFPEKKLLGKVRRVDDYPIPAGWFSSTVKEYATYVDIIDPPDGLRPGMTAQVRIEISRMPDVIQVPVQAVFEHAKRHYCLVRTAKGLEPREVKIGTTNEKQVVIQEGLSEKEIVLVNPRAHEDSVAMPEVPTLPERQEQIAARPTNEVASNEAEVPSSKTASSSKTEESNGGTADEPLVQVETARPVAGRAEGDDKAGEDDSASGDRAERRKRREEMMAMGPAGAAKAMFEQFDADHDGKLTESELPEQMRQFSASMDTNKDGSIDAAELTAAMRRFAAMRAGAGGGAPPAGGAGL
ncbi:MAG: HlyD family efflux transporter periplasmic adaptor subunit [Pirellulales bacterium]|nr:HlyD family efflux transporter periplasmic adaptor subunit [Pirellulales bacterium]